MLGPDDEYYENTLDEAEHRRKKYEMEDFSLTPYAEGTEALDTGSASDEQKLTLAWINERCAPALLMYQEELVSNLTEALELQVGSVHRIVEPGTNATRTSGRKAGGRTKPRFKRRCCRIPLSGGNGADQIRIAKLLKDTDPKGRVDIFAISAIIEHRCARSNNMSNTF